MQFLATLSLLSTVASVTLALTLPPPLENRAVTTKTSSKTGLIASSRGGAASSRSSSSSKSNTSESSDKSATAYASSKSAFSTSGFTRLSSSSKAIQPSSSGSGLSVSVTKSTSASAASASVSSSAIHRMLSGLFGKKMIRILMVGLDGAGKTTIFRKIKFGDIVTNTPETGFKVDNIEYKNIAFTSWDLVGMDKTRSLWKNYFQNTQGIVFVIDSNDRERISQAREELQRLLNEDELCDAPLLVFDNKQDLPNAQSAAEITDKLGLHSLRQQTWYIQATCAISGDGLYEGLEWLTTNMKKRA